MSQQHPSRPAHVAAASASVVQSMGSIPHASEPRIRAVRSLSLLVSSIQQRHTMQTRCMLPCVTHVCAHAFRHAWLRYAQMCGVGGLLQNRHCITCVHRADAQVVVLRGLRHAHGPDRFVLDGYRLVAFREHASAGQMVPLLPHRSLPLLLILMTVWLP